MYENVSALAAREPSNATLLSPKRIEGYNTPYDGDQSDSLNGDERGSQGESHHISPSCATTHAYCRL